MPPGPEEQNSGSNEVSDHFSDAGLRVTRRFSVWFKLLSVTAAFGILSVVWFTPQLREHLRLALSPAFSVNGVSLLQRDDSEQAPREWQMRLARWVFRHKGKVDVVVRADQPRLSGGVHDIADEKSLPAGEFMIWRVSLGADGGVDDRSIHELLDECDLAGFVEDLELDASGITPKGLAALAVHADTPFVVNLHGNAAGTPGGLVNISACPRLHELYVIAENAFAAPARDLAIRQIRSVLPDWEVSGR